MREERRDGPEAVCPQVSKPDAIGNGVRFTLDVRIGSLGERQEWWWPPSCPRDTSCASAFSLASWQDLSGFEGSDLVLSSSGPGVPSHNAAQELPRWSEGPEPMAMPAQAFLPMTVKLSGPLFFIYITDARVL